MKKNNIILVFLLTIDFVGLILIINGYLECSIFKWSVITLFIILPKILKISINETIVLLYYILIFLSSILGRIYDLYDKIMWYDSLVHFVSGILCFIFGLIIIKYFDKSNNIFFNALFCIMITMSLSVFWEFIELGSDYIFHTNMMKIQETGVIDTMKDVSVATLSSMLTSIVYVKSIDTNDTL